MAVVETKLSMKNFIKLNNRSFNDEYEYIKKISNACFGEIFLILHKKTKTKRILKIYNTKKMAGSSQNKFEEEIELIKNLDHPNIFKIYEFFKDPENFYLITEYLEGGELFDYVSTKKLTEKTIFIIFEQIISTINYLHKKNIIYRDIKLENLLLTKKDNINHIKLIDFGTSTTFEEDDCFMNPLGTCYYIAPEALRREYDEKADIWACGVLLYILFCGYAPFNGNNDSEVYCAILKNELVFEPRDWDSVSHEARDLVRKMLVKNPFERFGSEECIKHSWFLKNDQLHDSNLGSALMPRFKSFRFKNKLEQVFKYYVIQFSEMNEEKDDLMKVFKEYDVNHDGVLDFNEMKQICSKNHVGFSEQDFKKFDTNCDGKINYSEFLLAFYEFKQNVDINMIKEVFDLIDTDNNKTISPEELKNFLNLDHHDPLLQVIMKEADTNKDGIISYQEFADSLNNIFEIVI